MKYNGIEIVRNIITNTFQIYDGFKKAEEREEFETLAEAKARVDEILAENKNKRFQPVHYKRYQWAVMDKTIGWYYKKEDGKILLFNSSDACFKWCDENNGKFPYNQN